ncbi:MAG: hypothetical protein CMN76_19605 [Spirochaetaceae bacterium]|nr:hypothetical protein [Spirochaetaceae bacterium]|tara:strand:- start:41415 stop:42542 length:1128 start_codon:yes stop_codon:yes gene_type:complete
MRPSEKKALALALGVGYGISVPAFADLLILRNGDKLEGSVTGQTISSVNFVGDDGRVQIIPKSSIATIFYFSRQDKQKQEVKLVALKKEEQRKEREEELKKKREEDRKRREKELQEKREKERLARLEKKQEKEALEKALQKEKEEQKAEELAEKERDAEALRLEEQKRLAQQERRRLEALRLQKTSGLVRLWSGQEIRGTFVSRHGEVFTLETTAGLMDFHRSEIEQMEISVEENGVSREQVLAPSELEAVETVALSKDQIDLSSGVTVNYKSVRFDGFNTEVESEYGELSLRPEDAETSSNPVTGMDLMVGEYGYVMLHSGQKVSGDLILRSRHQWILHTEKGDVSLNPDEIVFARKEQRVSGDSFPASLVFWR